MIAKTARVTLEAHAEQLDDGWQAWLRADEPGPGGRFARAGLFYGPPPGSHTGWWRTRAGSVRGINYRVELSRLPRWRCLTFLLHYRFARPS